MKFNATLKATKELKTSISAIQSIIEEATFDVSEEGIKFRGLDMSNVSYIALDIPKDKFIDLKCEKATKFTVRTNEFLEILKRAKNNEEITLEMSNQNALQIYIGGKKHYTLPLIGIEKETQNPNFKLQTKIPMKFVDFADYVKDVAILSDNFIITTDETTLKFSGKGDSGKADVTITDITLTQNEQGVLRGEYIIERLVTMIKTLGAGFDDVVIEHGNNLPLKLTFDSESMGTLSYILAPKVV